MAGKDFRGQGATEYLVMLGIVLIVALVVASLINFYPGTVSDNQLVENQLYWRNAKPLAVYDIIAYPNVVATYTSDVAMTIKNTGDYPITLIKIFGDNASGAERPATMYADENGIYYPLSGITIMPGKSVCFGHRTGLGITTGNCPKRSVALKVDSVPSYVEFGGAVACKSDGTGIAKVIDFGFEYNETIGGKMITKRQVGPLLLARCQAN
ncbi:MAG: hypothetical protein QW568_01595 [Candidatus Anstonellaceae archaeon]